MRRKRVLVISAVLAMAVWAAASSPSSADGGSAPPSDELVKLKRQIESTERQLETERERGAALARRLHCTENQLAEYTACRRHFENTSEDYWRCVENALKQLSPCDTP